MELYLIRHGQSLNNSLPEEERVEDPPLTEVGRRQVFHLARWATTAGFTRLISSPFRRTLETAEPIRRSTGLLPEVWVDLHEQGGCVDGPSPEAMQGRPGMNRDKIREQFPNFRLADDIDDQGWWKSKPYETLEEAQIRAERTVRLTREEFSHTSQTVALVMHGTFKALMIRQFFPNTHADAKLLFEIHNTGISKITMTPDAARLEYYNQVPHLPEELVT